MTSTEATIIAAAADEFGIGVEDLTNGGRRRGNNLSIARRVTARLLWRLTVLNKTEISGLLGLDHTTIAYQLGAIAREMEEFPAIRKRVETLEARIRETFGGEPKHPAARSGNEFSALLGELRGMHTRKPRFVHGELRTLVRRLRRAIVKAAATATMLLTIASCSPGDQPEAEMRCVPRDLFLQAADGLPVWRGTMASSGTVIEIVGRTGGGDWAMFGTARGYTCLMFQGTGGVPLPVQGWPS